jgi:hypothetical protein
VLPVRNIVIQLLTVLLQHRVSTIDERGRERANIEIMNNNYEHSHTMLIVLEDYHVTELPRLPTLERMAP